MYPKMVKVPHELEGASKHLYVSEEQYDGTPDFIVERWGLANWRVKWRTSRGWDGPYKTKAEAFSSIRKAV